MAEDHVLQAIAAYERAFSIGAKQLHDNLGQDIAALRIKSKALENDISKGNGSAFLDHAMVIDQLAKKISKEVHYMMAELSLNATGDGNLFNAIATYVEYWSSRYGIAIDYQNGLEQNISLQLIAEASVCRILQESLTNIAKHSASDYVKVTLAKHDSRLVLIVEDNGCGFNVDAVLSSSNGLQSKGIAEMTARAYLAKGELMIQSTPNKGTTVIAKFPACAVAL